MSKEQIDKMTKILNETCNVYDEQGNHIRNKCGECECWSDDNHCCCSYNSKEAEALYNAGYREASDVARAVTEQFKEIAKQYLLEKGLYLAVFKNALNHTAKELQEKYKNKGESDGHLGS